MFAMRGDDEVLGEEGSAYDLYIGVFSHYDDDNTLQVIGLFNLFL